MTNIKKTKETIVNSSPKNYEYNFIIFIKEIVAKYYKEDVKIYETKARYTNVIKVKQICFYLIRENSNMSLSQISKYFNDCHHSTILHHVKTINNYLSWDVELKKDLKMLQHGISLKLKSVINNIDLDKDFYFIELNNFASIKFMDGKAILLSGFDEEELKDYIIRLNIGGDYRLHENTSMFILEDKEKCIKK